MTDQLRADPELGVFADAYPSALDRPGRPEEVATSSPSCSPTPAAARRLVVFVDGGTDALMNPG